MNDGSGTRRYRGIFAMLLVLMMLALSACAQANTPVIAPGTSSISVMRIGVQQCTPPEKEKWDFTL